MAEVLVSLPSFSKLSSRVWRVLGLNPGKFTLQGTNTYILGAGPKKILLDCGQGIPEYLPHLKESLKATQSDAYISDIIISHGHADHWGGLLDIVNCKSLNTDESIKVHKYPLPVGYHLEHMKGFPQDVCVTPLENGQIFKADDVTLKVIYTPGHTRDHCTFWLEEESALFTADCVLGQGTAVFEDLHEYLKGLERLVDLQPTLLYPGHGPVVENGTNKIQEYIEHRMKREDQIVQLFKQQRAWTPLEIVRVLYKDYPESLHPAATHSVVLHLDKLQKQDKVECLDSKWHWK